jgi:O-methyltransferase involved in polyketide biosynthesis
MRTSAPENTAARVALWRAMHVQIDPPPHLLADEIGMRLVAPEVGWRDRPDMDPRATSGFRAGVVARSRFIEDLVVERAARGVTQYVILGAGLDTFAQRRPEIASRERPGREAAERGARASGRPFISFFTPLEGLRSNHSWPRREQAPDS